MLKFMLAKQTRPGNALKWCDNMRIKRPLLVTAAICASTAVFVSAQSEPKIVNATTAILAAFRSHDPGHAGRNARQSGSNRFLVGGSTCARDVPPRTATWPLPRLPRPPIQPAHQDCQRNAQTPHPLTVGRDWPVMSTNQELRQENGGRKIRY